MCIIKTVTVMDTNTKESTTSNEILTDCGDPTCIFSSANPLNR